MAEKGVAVSGVDKWRQILGRAASLFCLGVGVSIGSGCSSEAVPDFDPASPARGPGELVGNGGPVSSGQFGQVTAIDPTQAPATVLACDEACESYCSSLAPMLTNPVDRGMCRNLWGVGLDTQPIDRVEACRRLFADFLGRFPTRVEAEETCGDRPFGDIVSDLMGREEFVLVNQRHWADSLLYNNEAVSIERIYDADNLVGKLYRGLVSYDQFAAVVSAHPVLTRRFDTPGDRAEALFTLFLRRPPFENERADMARLYALWQNGYYDHPSLNLRLPDAEVRYRCVTASGEVNQSTMGECTSVLWGYNQLILTPDIRAEVDRDGRRIMWSGLIKPHEWQALQAPGKIISQRVGFWEAAVDRVVEQYLGYNLGQQLPEVRQALTQHLLENNGDIRATHFAVATSLAYLQSSVRPLSPEEVVSTQSFTYGPLKQVLAEAWIDSVKNATGYDLAQCDHRIPRPQQLLDDSDNSVAVVALIENSRWQLTETGVRESYARLARTLGGCPDNQTGGRFTAVGILSTAVQENFVYDVCNPKQDPNIRGADIGRLLPPGVEADRTLSEDLAAFILEHQIGMFFSRAPKPEELEEARQAAAECAPQPCTAENLARPMCFALLSSSEQLFY